MSSKDVYFKVVCEEVDCFGKNIYEDANLGTLDEVHRFVSDRILIHPGAKWELYTFLR